MNWDLLVLFSIAVATFAFVPGPGIVYVVARTLAGGRSAGLAAAAGLHAGGYIHVFAAVLGLSVLLQNVPIAYLVLKLVGALYLAYLGLKMILTKSEDMKMPRQVVKTTFWQSFLVEALNPKAALFFLAFLPQFVLPDANWPVSMQLLFLGTIVNVAFSAADLVYIYAANAVQARLTKSATASVWAQRFGGTLLIGLGITLATSRAV